MDLDKNEGIKHITRDELGDFGADNIEGFQKWIANRLEMMIIQSYLR